MFLWKKIKSTLKSIHSPLRSWEELIRPESSEYKKGGGGIWEGRFIKLNCSGRCKDKRISLSECLKYWQAVGSRLFLLLLWKAIQIINAVERRLFCWRLRGCPHPPPLNPSLGSSGKKQVKEKVMHQGRSCQFTPAINNVGRADSHWLLPCGCRFLMWRTHVSACSELEVEWETHPSTCPQHPSPPLSQTSLNHNY